MPPSAQPKPRAMEQGGELEPSTPRSTTPTAGTTGEVLLDKYKLGRLLGRGSFAKVYHARRLADNTDVAIKVIQKTQVANTAMEPRIIHEVSAMRRLRHSNIIQIHEVMATKSKIYLVMEYARGGELLTKIYRRGRLTEPVARHYFQQLCHSHGIAHRDVKPQNLLLDHKGNLKVSDFGLSALPEQLKDGLLHTACGTPAYTAPEVLGRKAYDGAKADAWSCGVILFVFLAGFMPFDDANLAVMYRKIHHREYQFPSWFSKPIRWIISRLLDPNPETRLSIPALMEVAWFKKSLRDPSDGHINPFDLDLLALPKDAKFNTTNMNVRTVMNAFDIISLSSGLDLSGLFEAGRKSTKRFTSMASSAENIVERVTEIGKNLGYVVQKSKCGVVGLGKGRLVMLVEVLEVTDSLFLVEMKDISGEGAKVEEAQWRDMKAELQDIALAWHDDGVSEL
uniref:non-specific serine/threonine protein kinase n=1 Tax=Nelumbo nucifera TaxID=4432 RepID=A0A822XKV2_NELNU|nr:TPA_asm: hypothetical protein HUJ06_021172 [Nelumbo nucifera]